jgi:hypothetical protein
MPLFMDLHENLPQGTTAEDVAGDHAGHGQTPDRYGVRYLKFWIDERSGRVFCLLEAPDVTTATLVHREAHGGWEAGPIHQVQEGS